MSVKEPFSLEEIDLIGCASEHLLNYSEYPEYYGDVLEEILQKVHYPRCETAFIEDPTLEKPVFSMDELLVLGDATWTAREYWDNEPEAIEVMDQLLEKIDYNSLRTQRPLELDVDEYIDQKEAMENGEFEEEDEYEEYEEDEEDECCL